MTGNRGLSGAAVSTVGKCRNQGGGVGGEKLCHV